MNNPVKLFDFVSNSLGFGDIQKTYIINPTIWEKGNMCISGSFMSPNVRYIWMLYVASLFTYQTIIDFLQCDIHIFP